jgi:hypothetical protein
MTNKLFKLAIDVPATLNKAKSLLMALDKNEGKMFRIEKMWLSVVLDAIAATDSVEFQISSLSQNEATSLYALDSEYEIFTKIWDFHLGEAALTGLDDLTICAEVPGIEGTLLDCSEKNYLTVLALGQAGATASAKIKILGQYVRTEIEDWNFNKF